MQTYEVAFPIVSGYQVFTVKAKSEDEAVEKCLAGQGGDSALEDVEADFDSNLAIVDEI